MKKFILKLCNSISAVLDKQQDLIKTVINEEEVYVKQHYFTGTLNTPRYSKEDFDKLIANSRARYKDETIDYVLVADSYYDVNLPAPFGRLTSHKDIDVNRKEVVYLLALDSDEDMAAALKAIYMIEGVYYYSMPKYYPTARYYHKNKCAKSVLINSEKKDLGKFEFADFENILQIIEATKNVGGDYVEIGVFQGRSAECALSYMKATGIERTVYLLDTFEGFNYIDAESSKDSIWYGTHSETSETKVAQLLDFYTNKKIVKSNIITNELPKEIKEIAVCNIDVDMYEAVKSALYKVHQLVVVGGVIIVEDQGHTPALAGACLAITEFLGSEAAKNFLPIHMTSGQMLLVRCF